MNEFNSKVCFVILNYNSFDYTMACIKSLFKQTYKNFDILIIDNNSIDDSIEKLSKLFSQIKIIKNKKNLGFAGGCNVGIKYAIKENFDYIFLLNNDTIAHPKMLETLIDCSVKNPQAGIITGKIYYMDEQNKIWYAGGKLNLYSFEGIHCQKNRIENENQGTKTKVVDFASGCMMMTKREVFDEVGLFDEFLFANYEDIDLCIRLKKSRFKVLYNEPSILWHKGSPNFISHGRLIKYKPFMYYLRVRNKIYLISKYKTGYRKIISYLYILPKLAKYFIGFILLFQLKNLQYVIYGIYDGYFKKNIRVKEGL